MDIFYRCLSIFGVIVLIYIFFKLFLEAAYSQLDAKHRLYSSYYIWKFVLLPIVVVFASFLFTDPFNLIFILSLIIFWFVFNKLLAKYCMIAFNLNDKLQKSLSHHTRVEKELHDMHQSKIQKIENDYHEKVRTLQSRYTKEISDLDTIFVKIEKAFDQMSDKEIKDLYCKVYSFLFPERESDSESIRSSLDSIKNTAAFKEQILERIKIVTEYNINLRIIDHALHNKNSDVYSYIPIAEAYSNRIIADWYKGHFNQTEVLPIVSSITTELQTLYLTSLANQLDWGSDKTRLKKVASLRELKQETAAKLEEANLARYQLEYLLSIYPQLQDILDIEYKDLDSSIRIDYQNAEHDSVRDFLSREEYDSLSVTERNQLALDRYVASHSKTKWQIGRDYELYIGYLCQKEKATVSYTGCTLKFEDLGRDLIVKKNSRTYIIQCKYWSLGKTIHEKHIMQLFGTVMEYKIANTSTEKVIGVFVTSTALSDMAKRFAEELGIVVYENVPMGDYPRIKCNIGENGFIYHLPMDLNYDSTKIDKPGEFFALTVKEAEAAGFRRSYKWHNTST